MIEDKTKVYSFILCCVVVLCCCVVLLCCVSCFLLYVDFS